MPPAPLLNLTMYPPNTVSLPNMNGPIMPNMMPNMMPNTMPKSNIYGPKHENAYNILTNRDTYNPLPTDHMMYMYNPANNITIQKHMNVNVLGGPIVNHGQISQVFEDIIPIDLLSNDKLIIRTDLVAHIRNKLFPNGDGQDISLLGTEQNSLLHKIQFLDVNPYRLNNNANPYSGLPSNYLLYRSCYPIQQNRDSNRVECSKNAIAINIRIHKLTNNEYSSSDDIEMKKLSVAWREQLFYEYTKSQILKTKESPHFLYIHGYYLVSNSRINFNNVEKARNKDATTVINTKDMPMFVPKNSDRNTLQRNPDISEGQAMIILTEAPISTLKKWARSDSKQEGVISKEIYSGYHNEQVWRSVLFQVVQAFHTLQNHKILLNNFDPEKSVYIRDISFNNQVTGHWKYVVGNIQYYVPNYGFQVFIDLNNLNTNNPKTVSETIYGDTMPDDYLKIIAKQCAELFNSNLYAVPPPRSIIEWMNSVREYIMKEKSKPTDYNLMLVLDKYFTMLMNNRIGTALNDDEVKLVNNINTVNDIVRGDYVTSNNKFYICIHVDNKTPIIIDRDGKIVKNPSNVEKWHYPLKQKFKQGVSGLDEDDLIEIYNI